MAVPFFFKLAVLHASLLPNPSGVGFLKTHFRRKPKQKKKGKTKQGEKKGKTKMEKKEKQNRKKEKKKEKKGERKAEKKEKKEKMGKKKPPEKKKGKKKSSTVGAVPLQARGPLRLYKLLTLFFLCVLVWFWVFSGGL